MSGTNQTPRESAVDGVDRLDGAPVPGCVEKAGSAGHKESQALARRLQAQGYDLDELERDNPYNQWLHER